VELRIDQQFGQIGLKYTPFQYNLDIRSADLQIDQTAAEIFSEQPAATLEIDYTLARESLGYMGIKAQMDNFVQEAKITQSAGVERRVAEGNELGSIEKGISIGDIAARATDSPEKELVLARTQPIRIDIQVNHPSWEVQQGGINGSFVPGDAQGDLTFGKVETYLEREPYINIYTVGNIIDEQS